jgi:hypothetical protein
MSSTKLSRTTARKNFDSQFTKQEVRKTKFELKAESLNLTTDEQIRKSKEMRDWVKRYAETRFVPLAFLAHWKIVTPDQREASFDVDAPKFRASVVREAWRDNAIET